MNRTATHNVTLIPGDGIGPECVRAAQRIVDCGRSGERNCSYR